MIPVLSIHSIEATIFVNDPEIWIFSLSLAWIVETWTG